MRDAYYTDLTTARAIVDCLEGPAPRSIADFAVGEGALLQAARERWPEASLFAADIEPQLERPLRQRFETVCFSALDFFCAASRAETPWLSSGAFADLVIINPPFSCRGRRRRLTFEGSELRCGTAMAFLIESLQFLAAGGKLVALLPASCFTSDRDRAALQILKSVFDVQKLSLSVKPRFPGCSVETIVVRLQPHAWSEGKGKAPSRAPVFRDSDLQITRGQRPNERIAFCDQRSLAFVHTTELKDHRVWLQRWLPASGSDRIVAGPAVLLPRVGRPNPAKICWLPKGTEVSISDCIIAVKAQTEVGTSDAFSFLRRDSTDFASLYVGSCARYLTIRRLRNFLAEGMQQVAVDKPRLAA